MTFSLFQQLVCFLDFRSWRLFFQILIFWINYLSKSLFLELLFLLSVVLLFSLFFVIGHVFTSEKNPWNSVCDDPRELETALDRLSKPDWLISVFMLMLCFWFFFSILMLDWCKANKKEKHWLKINKNCFPFLSNSLEVENLCWFMLENFICDVSIFIWNQKNRK